MNDVAPSLTVEQLMSSSAWLRKLAGGLLRDDAAADDAVQETLIGALHRPPREQGRLRGWLGTVLTNRIRTAARAGRRRQWVLAEMARAPVEPVPSPEEALARRELQSLVSAALLELPPGQQQVIVLRYFEDLDSAAIGLRLGVPPGTVRWRLSQGLAALRARLDARAGERWRMVLAPLWLPRGLPRRLSLAALGAATSVAVLGGVLAVARPPGPRVARHRAPAAAAPSGAGLQSAGATPPPPRFVAAESHPAAAPASSSERAVGALAPFTGVRWRGDRPEVEVGGRWSELLAIDGMSVEAILLECRRRYPGELWRKRFSEDLVDVLTELGHPPGLTVSLTLLEGGTVVAPLTRENRRQVLERNNAGVVRPPPSLVDNFARVSPFEGLRYQGERIDVELDGAWSALVSINGVRAEQLVAFAQQRYGRLWRKRIAEDLVEVLRDLGAPVTGTRVDVVVAGGQRRSLELTEENRQAVRKTWEMRSRD